MNSDTTVIHREFDVIPAKCKSKGKPSGSPRKRNHYRWHNLLPWVPAFAGTTLRPGFHALGALAREWQQWKEDKEMSEVDTLKAEIKKLSAKAMQAKMDLHDLSEELPINWQQILDVAQRAHAAFSTLEGKRARMKQLETA